MIRSPATFSGPTWLPFSVISRTSGAARSMKDDAAGVAARKVTVVSDLNLVSPPVRSSSIR